MSTLDELDWKILDALQGDPEQTYTMIAKDIAAPPESPVHRNTIINRIKKLKESGILEFPTCAINPTKLGFQGVGVICLKMEPLQIENTAKLLASYAEVTCLGTTMGAFDIAFQVVTKDAKELQNFINGHVRTLPGFIDVQILTFVEMVKNTHKINLTPQSG
ncbi:MAG: Lrp/AsnC family transcriptional regulator [Candidatus Hodarchaeales archaeon]|jgi:DNA-binding Lrp family transcriptional regulator